MTSGDIVERLSFVSDHVSVVHPTKIIMACDDAIAEIRRLHAQNERMRKTLREVEPFLTGLPYPKRDQLHALVVSTLKDQP